MADNTAKLHVKIDGVSVTYEGPADLLEERLAPLVREISMALDGRRVESRDHESRLPMEEDQPVRAPKDANAVGTIDNVAAKLDCKTGPDLIVATAAFLTFGAKAVPRFNRRHLLDEMKTSSYHKKTYTSNMSTYLQGLVKKQKLSEVTKGEYQLPPAHRDELKTKLNV